MSIQPTSIILGSRMGAPPEESAIASLLQTLSKVLDVVRRRWPLLAIPMLTVMLITLSAGLTCPRRYYVSTTFERRNNLVISKLLASNSPYSFAALRQSLMSDLRSFSAVGLAVEEMGLLDHLPHDGSGELTAEARTERDAIVGRWVESITVVIHETGDFSDTVEIRYLGEQPDLAAPILTKIRDGYIAGTRNKVSGILSDAHEFFAQESRKCQETVTALRTELQRIDMEFPGTNPAGPDTLEQRMQAIEQSIDRHERERQRLQAKIASSEAYLAELGAPPSSESTQPNRPAAMDRNMTANPRYQQTVAEIASLNKKIEELRVTRRMTEMHPQIVTLRRQVESLEASLDELPEHLEGPLGMVNLPADPWLAERKKTEIEIRTNREDLARVEVELKADLEVRERLKKDMQSLPERREQHAKLQQALAGAQNDLDLWTNNLSQLNRILAAEAENRGIQVEVLDEPHLAGRLRMPTANSLFAIGSGLGLALAIAIVFFREILDRSVKDPARLKETLGIPILETIGEIRVGRPEGWFIARWVLPVFVAIQMLAVGVMGVMVYLALERPEQYDRLITRSAAMLGTWTGGVPGT
ncbi:MAG: hypothetical protein QUV05_04335 [Phycisphaerae bacterium]|nr:hypothetical protein [Phycisphaerae bacterium]